MDSVLDVVRREGEQCDFLQVRGYHKKIRKNCSVDESVCEER